MFLKYAKRKWEGGLISVGLPAIGQEGSPSIEGRGMAALAIKCLSPSERDELVEFAKKNSIAKRVAERVLYSQDVKGLESRLTDGMER